MRGYSESLIESMELLNPGLILITFTSKTTQKIKFTDSKVWLIEWKDATGRLFIKDGLWYFDRKEFPPFSICSDSSTSSKQAKAIIAKASKEQLNKNSEPVINSSNDLNKEIAKKKLETYAKQAVEAAATGNYEDACDAADLVYKYSEYLKYELADKNKLKSSRDLLCSVRLSELNNKLESIKKPYANECSELKNSKQYCANANDVNQCLKIKFPMYDTFQNLCGY
jgi:DNA polymerase IIIc chi subunit